MKIILDSEVNRAKVNLHKGKLCRQAIFFNILKMYYMLNSVRDKVKKYSDLLITLIHFI